MKNKKQITQDDITLEASLLKALAIKKNYDQFSKTLDTKRLIPATSGLLKDYARYYEQYNADINWEVFYTDFVHNWHKKDLDESDITYYRETVFPLIQNSRTENVFTQLLQKEAAGKIQELTESGDFVQIQDVLSSLNNQLSVHQKDNNDSVFKLGKLDLTTLDTSNGLKWFLPALQAGLGSHMPGQFVVVAADSDTGKSAFCISQAVHVFKQLHINGIMRPILYCTSEDTKEDLAARFLSCLYRDKCPGGFEQIVSDFDKISTSYQKHFNDNLFIGMQIHGHNDMYKLRQNINTYQPCVVIIDMLDKLSSSDQIQDLTKLYQEIRGMANDGVPIIGTSQTGNTSYQDKETGKFVHRRHLSDKDLSGSKSGKQGAAYCMIMIGKDDDVPNIRYVDTTKKKRGKHVSVTCQIHEAFSLYTELL